MDTKVTVDVGPFSHRQAQSACDHDFQASATLTPFGILPPETGENHLWFTESRVTADCMVDRLEEMVPRWKKQFGPESNVHRTQWLKRLVVLSPTN